MDAHQAYLESQYEAHYAQWQTCQHCTEEYHIDEGCKCQESEWKTCPACEWEHREDSQTCSNCSKQ